MIGIALLTLVPGEMGGSESATSGLLQALARSGTLPYRVYLPPAAPDAHEGLPYEVVSDYRRAQSRLERLAALGLATLRPEPLRRRLRSADVVHYPFTIRVPSVEALSVVTLHDLQHIDLPQLFSRAERAFRSVYYHRSARAAARVVVPSTFVRVGAVGQLGIDPSRLALTTRLNGQVAQEARTDDMIFSVGALIEYCSAFTPLHPGDVIITGTTGGVGA